MDDLVWSAVAYACCMLFDMLAMNRAGFAYIAPPGAPTIDPKFWIGWSVRHLLLAPIAILLQHLIRYRIEEFSFMWASVGVLAVAYLGTFVRDLLRQVGSKSRGRKSHQE